MHHFDESCVYQLGNIAVQYPRVEHGSKDNLVDRVLDVHVGVERRPLGLWRSEPPFQDTIGLRNLDLAWGIRLQELLGDVDVDPPLI